MPDTYEDTFDEFLRNYLTVLYAPEPLVKRDIYYIFKRHVSEQGLRQEGTVSSTSSRRWSQLLRTIRRA